jgi:hypothetical protein
MADAVLSSYSPVPPHAGFSTFRGEIGDPDISIDVGQPLGPTLLSVAYAQADDAATANVLGLASSAGEQAGSYRRGHVNIQPIGPMALTTAQWDRVTGQVGGLTPFAPYYLSAAAPGMLTTTPPGGGFFVTPVGFGMNATTMMIQIAPAVFVIP